MKNPNSPPALSAAPPVAAAAEPSAPSPAQRTTAPKSAVENPLAARTLREFAEVEEEAVEMGVEPPSAKTKATAEKILTALLREFPRYYAVSPGEGREVSIETGDGMGTGRGVLIVCDDNGVACHVVRPNNDDQSIRHSSANGLPDDFIRKALRELG